MNATLSNIFKKYIILTNPDKFSFWSLEGKNANFRYGHGGYVKPCDAIAKFTELCGEIKDRIELYGANHIESLTLEFHTPQQEPVTVVQIDNNFLESKESCVEFAFMLVYAANLRYFAEPPATTSNQTVWAKSACIDLYHNLMNAETQLQLYRIFAKHLQNLTFDTDLTPQWSFD